MFHGGIYHIFRARVPSRVCGGARCVSRVPVGVSPIGMPREGVGIRIIRSSKREGTNQSLELENFRAFGTSTAVNHQTVDSGQTIAVLKSEFWTSKQRAASSLREVSYRACFKPQLPRFFIERLTQPGDLVYDPFMGGDHSAGGDASWQAGGRLRYQPAERDPAQPALGSTPSRGDL